MAGKLRQAEAHAVAIQDKGTGLLFDAALLPLLNDREFATEFFIIAGLKATIGDALVATARKTELPLCPRCRKHEPLLESGLCERCDEVAG